MRKSALVVDDSDINIKIISALLGAFGLDCTKAASGAEAVELVKYFETKKSGEPGFSFILVDHLMYGMDGIETTKKICEISKIPVYGMSGSITDQLVDEFKAAGAVDAFPKPVTPGTIHKVLCGCLEEGDYILPKDLLELNEPKTSEESLLRECLKGVPGIDYEKGLKTALGKDDAYLQFLKMSADEIRGYAAVLDDFVHDSDSMKLKIAAHSLKTIFANIGIETLRTDSEVVETAADKLCQSEDGTIPNIMFYEHVNTYRTNALATATAILRATEEYERILDSGADRRSYLTAEEPLDARDRAEVISYTMNALKRFEYDYILEGLEKLSKAATGNEKIQFEKAISAVKNFDYDKAAEIVTKQSSSI